MELKKELDQMISSLLLRFEEEKDNEQKANILLYAFCEMILTASQVSQSEIDQVAKIYANIQLIPSAKQLDNFEETLANLNIELSSDKEFDMRERAKIVRIAMDVSDEDSKDYLAAQPLIDYFREKRDKL